MNRLTPRRRTTPLVVSSVPPPVPGITPVQRMRWLVVGMGALMSILAVLLVFVALRMRTVQAKAAAAQAAAVTPSKPVINAANPRRAA